MTINTQVQKVCKTCSATFFVIKCRDKTAKYCSRKCQRPTKNQIEKARERWLSVPKSEEWKKRMSEAKKGESNPMWKGDNAGLDAIHVWVHSRYPKKELCEICNEVPPIDLANISQKYHRNTTDWEWLCRKCHMTKDGRLENLKKVRFIKTKQ